MGTIGQIPSGKLPPNAYKEFDFAMRGGDPITDSIAKSLRADNPVPKGYAAPDVESRLAGVAEGEHLGTRPGRMARDIYEKSPTRVAAVGPTGTVYRGNKSMIHLDVFNKMMQPHEKIPLQELFDYEMDAEDTGNVGYTNREGKYLSRAEQAARLGYEEAEPGLAGESFVQRKLLSDMTTADRKALERANTVNPQAQYRRRTQGRKAHQALAKLGEERTYLERINRHMQSEKITSRVKDITKRIGNLKNMAIRKGVLGVTAAAGSLVTPFSTWESIQGLRSGDKDTQLRSVESLLGLPDYSTGRNPTTQEQIEGEPVIDKATGEVIGGYL
jgi:hypothetical protein